jgi:hypothetical protein
MVAGDSEYSSGVAPETVLRSFCFKGAQGFIPLQAQSFDR